MADHIPILPTLRDTPVRQPPQPVIHHVGNVVTTTPATTQAPTLIGRIKTAAKKYQVYIIAVVVFVIIIALAYKFASTKDGATPVEAAVPGPVSSPKPTERQVKTAINEVDALATPKIKPAQPPAASATSTPPTPTIPPAPAHPAIHELSPAEKEEADFERQALEINVKEN